MSSETIAALLWLVVNVAGLAISVRAIIRGARQLKGADNPVSSALHVAEIASGTLFTLAFLVSAGTALLSIYFLPSPEYSEYAAHRAASLRYMLFTEKFFYIGACLIPEVLDRYLVRYAAREQASGDGTASVADAFGSGEASEEGDQEA